MAFVIALLCDVLASLSYADTLPVLSGLHAWYNMESLSDLSDGDAVYSWKNSQGNTGLNLYAPSQNPIYNSTGVIGNPSLSFSNGMSLWSADHIGLTGDASFSIFLLV